VKQPAWRNRLVGKIGKELAEGSSKHSRAKKRPKNYRAKRKTRRKMTRASRKVNRRK